MLIIRNDPPLNDLNCPLTDGYSPLNRDDLPLSEESFPLNHIFCPLTDVRHPLNVTDSPLMDDEWLLHDVNLPPAPVYS